jgi:hypothetical protein
VRYNSAVAAVVEEFVMPEINADARMVMLLITVASLIAFLLMVWVFAFYM